MKLNKDRSYSLNAKQLRSSNLVTRVKKQVAKKKVLRNEIYLILDNVLDTYNIGSIFRLADAVGARKIYLCGGSETPPNHRIKKASINTTEVVDWEYCDSTVEAIARIKNLESRIMIVGIEQAYNSVQYTDSEYKFPLALVVGHESDGISQEVLDLCDRVVELPMFGVNRSLNVMVSLGIVLYHILDARDS